MKQVYILAYSKMNLGDDLFIDMLLKKYKNVQFYSKNMTMESNTYKVHPNLHFIDYSLDDLLDLDITIFDAFVYIGGSIFMEKAGGIERVQKLEQLSIRCNSLGIPFYYISSNFGPYQTLEYKETVSRIFQNVTDVCLRDKASYELFKEIPTVRYSPDAILDYPIKPIEPEKNTIGISLINFKFRPDLKKYEKKYLELLTNTIQNFINQGYKVKLFCFCKYEGDEETAQYLLSKLTETQLVEIVTYSGNITEFLKKYSKVEYMICSRFHSVILSYQLKQKLYVLSYSSKINNVINDLNLVTKFETIKNIKNIDLINIDDFENISFNPNIREGAKYQFEELDNFLLYNKPLTPITVIIPAHNEEKSIQKVVRLVKRNKLVTQILVVDNNSTDGTGRLARLAGAEVVNCIRQGKGYAMEEGLKNVKNNIIVFIDADINNYPKDLIELLSEPIVKGNADFVKSMFDRKGGRVTELVAKPLLDLLFPGIYKFSQPLSGMIAGKKDFFNKVCFEKDYGVDIGILLDMININARITEVHIGTLKNDSQQWQALEKMSKEVMAAIIKRANFN